MIIITRPSFIILFLFSLSPVSHAIDGESLGKVSAISKASGEITVQANDAAGKIKMGDILYLRLDETVIKMRATFPMMNVVKCTITPRNAKLFSSINRGQVVYRYIAGVEDKQPVTQLGASRTIGDMVFIFIKGGSFMMGDEKGLYYEKPVHQVTVDSFWMGKYEVSQKLYRDIMGSNPSEFTNPQHPVERVTWDDAMRFCRKFSEKYKVNVRLPYEAEWEYACRAGSTTRYYWGDTANSDYCWYLFNSVLKTHPIGQKRPNAWGLYDMTGNVGEWCEDRYDEDYYKNEKEVNNPKGASSGKLRVMRGGYWGVPDGHELYSAGRLGADPGKRLNYAGFRILLLEK